MSKQYERGYEWDNDLEDLQSRATKFDQLGNRLMAAADEAEERVQELRKDLDALERIHGHDPSVFSGFSYDRSKDVWSSCVDDANEEHLRCVDAAITADGRLGAIDPI